MAATKLPREIQDIIFSHVYAREDLNDCVQTCTAWHHAASARLHHLHVDRAVEWAILKRDDALLNDMQAFKKDGIWFGHLSLAIIIDNTSAAEALLGSSALLCEWRRGRHWDNDRMLWMSNVRRTNQTQDRWGRSPLVAAVARRNRRLVDLMLAIPGLDLDARDAFGFIPIGVACASDQAVLDQLSAAYRSKSAVTTDRKPPRCLLDDVASPPPGIGSSRAAADVGIIQALLNAGHNVDGSPEGEVPPPHRYAADRRSEFKLPPQLPPLYLAARSGRIDIMELLVSRGAAVDGFGNLVSNVQPLMGAAAIPGNVEAVRFLLARSADATRVGDNCGSALHLAADAAIAEELLLAEPWAIDDYSGDPLEQPRVTPLAAAIHDRRPKTSLFLLGKGAKPCALDYAGCDLMRTAARRGVAEVIPALAALGLDIVSNSAEDGVFCNRWAAVKGDHVDVVRQMLALGVGFSKPRTWTGETGKVRAGHLPICWVRSADMLNLLVGCSGDLNERIGTAGWTTFMVAMTSRGNASEEDRRAIVRIFLKHGADMFVKDDVLGRNALHWAVGWSDEITADELIRQGADVNLRDTLGWTPLKLACKRRHNKMVKMLLDNGADVHDNTLERSSRVSPPVGTALDIALENRMTVAVRALLEAGADPVAAKDYPANTVRQMLRWRLPALGYSVK